MRLKDRSAVPQLVRDLDSDDPAVRFYTIQALRELTGQDFGYDYTDDDEEERKPAIGQWRAWLSEQQQPAAIGAGDRRTGR